MTAAVNPTDTTTDIDTTASPFAEALWEVDYLLDTDPDRARDYFTFALTLTTPAERQFLERAADLLARSPWPVAARQLGWIAKSRPELRAMVIDYTTDTDPGLHVPGMPEISEVPIETAEWVRRSIRERRERLTATPSPVTDAARLRPEAIAARRARTQTHAPVPEAVVSLRHRDRDLRTARRLESEYAAYAADRLYAIDTGDEPREAAGVPDPRKPAQAVWSHVQAKLWDRSYIRHVAENYTDRDRELLDPETPATTWVRSGRHTALDDRASAFLREHGADTAPAAERPARSRRRRTAARRPRITAADQMGFAARRTGLAIPSDYDIFLPYSELDVPESTWQGSGLDYDLAAMVPYLGWPCVGCWIDRPDSDRRAVHIRDGRPVSDDGLCDVCRADGHPGIPALSTPWGMREFVESRCAYIAATHPGQARALLDRVRAAAANTGPTWRLITRWMAMNLDAPEPLLTARPATPRRRRPSALGAGQRIGRCDACARSTIVHADNYCTQCRVDLGIAAPREPGRRAA
ncbi:hypothetical protein [Nocardia rhamnosiphila]|uniref:Uncharacterized protein n=1 Tax=Nocardia rhamnosiphila TaxID=426716 RepID=A0ABV2WR72_9NOCA